MDRSTSSGDEARRSGAGRLGMRTRMLAAGSSPALELIEAEPHEPRTGAPILLVHGAFGGAWMWAESFIPFLARRGRAVAAVSLRGHGASEGRSGISQVTLDDYLDDLRRAIGSFPQAPVVVGHSLGGLLAQRLIGRVEMRALVLLASLPPDGMAIVGARAAFAEPLLWIDAFLGATTRRRSAVTAAQELLFSRAMPRERMRRYVSRLTPESPRALTQAHMPGPVLSAFLCRLPTLVMAAQEDRIVWRSCTLRTAFFHAATHATLEGVGHLPMLDVRAEAAARRLLDWLDHEGL